MTAPPLRTQFEAWCLARVDELGLSGRDLLIEQMANPSGWYQNTLYRVSDGASALVAKLGPDREALRSTYDLRDVLVPRYRCPPVVSWIELDEVVGYVMQHVPSIPAPEDVIPGVLETMDRLLGDSELAARLPDEDQPDTMREAFGDIWIERLTSDLGELEAEDKVPPFISASLLDWMRYETSLLEELTRVSAFDLEPIGAVHGDLHLANVLVEPSGRWWIVDWDGVHCGDPAADAATLLQPLIERGESLEQLLGQRDEHFRARFDVCARAVLLDLVVDSLADWADADLSPGLADEIRSSMRSTHERALVAYRERY